MKKIQYIVLLLIMCVSCDYEEYKKSDESHVRNWTEQKIRENTQIDSLDTNIRNIKFDGHLYVLYADKNGYGYGVAMVHSPNCACDIKK